MPWPAFGFWIWTLYKLRHLFHQPSWGWWRDCIWRLIFNTFKCEFIPLHQTIIHGEAQMLLNLSSDIPVHILQTHLFLLPIISSFKNTIKALRLKKDTDKTNSSDISLFPILHLHICLEYALRYFHDLLPNPALL